MSDEIKEILDKWNKLDFDDYSLEFSTDYIERKEQKLLLDYITNLQQKVEQYENPDDLTLFYMWLDEKAKDKMKALQEENERLKNNQIKALNRIKDFINSSKCEITEGHYSNDKHSQYWAMFKEFAEELQDKIKGIDTKEYVYIPRWREQELLNQEEQLEDYKARIEKAVEFIKENADYGLEEKCCLNDLNYYNCDDLLNILQGENDGKI